MARVVMSTYMVRYPMGVNLSWALQYALGVQRLGHDLYLVEKATSSKECWDLAAGEMTDEPSYGWKVTSALLRRFGLADRFCFVDVNNVHLGLPKVRFSFDDAAVEACQSGTSSPKSSR